MIPDISTDSQAYLNGEFLPLHEAKISVLDRGFIFGDGVYDVVPVYDGRPFLMREHLNRLNRSLDAIGIASPYEMNGWIEIIKGLLTRSTDATCLIYLQVTRGVAKRDHSFPGPDVTPTVLGMVMPFSPPNAVKREQGISLISISDERWLHCDIKSISLLGNVLAKQKAVEAGGDEAAQFRDNMLSEGASCNIWVVAKHGFSKGSVLNYTHNTPPVDELYDMSLLAPSTDHFILKGIRYELIKSLAEEANISLTLRPISREEVENASEILVSSAGKEILPVCKLDNKPVGNGKPGPVYAKLRAGYDRAIAELKTMPRLTSMF